ncbi:hypothetical protein BZA05DRAFT_122591 [Tricharina praecox]|uniref:uncharacterized protein n=1 Tax=Tricharina praecox TaxID=43433 RepID=UPI00221FBA67|nr:uncharacterized protein BZA05DRAFT_122591 [Tricharina praecox]KAI5847420.1 hypothetical protein BZA05DRAFT_122591 [Tricharina praecox]
MPRKSSKRVLSNLDDLTSSPPDAPLPPSQIIARITQAQGKNLFTCSLADGSTMLAELAPIFRGKAWMRRGGFVLLDTVAFEGRDNKIDALIVNVVRNDREWRKMEYWPKEFPANTQLEDSDDDEEESTMGKMPPNSDDEE